MKRSWLAGLAALAGLVLASATGAASARDEPVPPVVGTVLPAPPSAVPGVVPPEPGDPLHVARQRWMEGDAAGVVVALSPWLESRRAPWGRTRTAGHLLLGVAHMTLENWNLASRHFYNVRRTTDPLASYGAWYEALVDHKRGRHLVAVNECNAYREKWPEGPKADECLLLVGDAYSAQGMRGSSIASYERYLERHPDTPREEEIRLAIALAVARTQPERGIPMLHELMLNHSYPSTDLAAQHALQELAAQGHDTRLSDDSVSLMRRAGSLRRSGKLGEAWELFTLLTERAADDPQVAAWVEENEDRYTWGTRRYDVYAQALEAQYAKEPTAELCWGIFQAWGRAGEWARAAAWGRKGMEAHQGDWRWRQARDDMAWATMLAGEFADASERWESLGKAGGDFGRQARFYAAFCALQAGDAARADTLFETVVKRGSDWTAAGHYWRARAREALGRTEDAAADRAAAIAQDETGWYSLLLDTTAVDAASAHDGTWHGPPPTALPEWRRPELRPATSARLWAGSSATVSTDQGLRPALEAPAAGADRWSDLGWERLHAAATRATGNPLRDEPPGELPRAGLPIPDGYVASAWYDPVEAEKDFYRFAEDNRDLWPALPAAYDLANAGLYDEAAKVVFPVFEEWRSARANPGESTRAFRIASLPLDIPQWRQLVLFARDHYHAARTSYGLDKYGDDPATRLAAARLAYPIVRARELWKYGQAYGIDPYLMLAIMRQESTYANHALSPAGAVGLVQVMPSTGAKVAALMGEHRYSPRDLEDPATNLRFGTFYFARLMERFEDSFPLAVGSYNGGPHNLSRWYRPWVGNIDTDAMVEMIRFDESRDYVKKVTGHYARYVAVYEPGSRVVVPTRPAGDDASVIDF